MGRRVITEKEISKYKAKAQVKALGAEGLPTPTPDDYVSKVAKYIPVEIVAAFVAIEGIIKSTAQPPIAAYWIAFFALLVLTPLYIWRVTTEPNKPPAKAQIIISAISFPLWVFALGGPFSYLSWYQPIYGALLLPIYTIAVPIIVGK